jgi:hypothetical protein
VGGLWFRGASERQNVGREIVVLPVPKTKKKKKKKKKSTLPTHALSNLTRSGFRQSVLV